MAKKFSLAIEIGGALKESFKSVVGASKRELKAIQRYANIKIGLSLKESKEKLKKQLSGWKSIAGTAISIGTPIVVGANFEYQMKRVKALANATSEQFQLLEEKARQLGATTQYSASEVGKAMEYLSMAGFKVGETLDATGGVLNLATVGNVDLGTSADIASNILSGFGMKAKEINRVVDVMAKTITSSNTSVVELGETMKYVAPVAKSFGVSVEEVSAMAGLLGNVGIKGSMAGTTLSAIFSRLSAPTGEAARALAMLGVQTKDLKTGKMRNIANILKDLNNRLSMLPKFKKMELIKQIFGEEAMKGAIPLIEMAGSGELQKYIKEIKNAKGTAEKMVKDMNDTVLAKWKSVLSAVEGIFLTIYKPLEPILKFTLDTVVGGLRILNKVLEFTAPVLSPVVFGFGALFITSKLVAIGTTVLRFGLLNVVKAMLTAHFSSLRLISSLIGLRGQSVLTAVSLNSASNSLKIFWGKVNDVISSTLKLSKNAFKSVIAGVKRINFAFLTSPVFWIGAAIAGVGYLIYRNWDKLKGFFSGFWKGFKEGFKPVIDSFKGVFGVLKPVFDGLKTVFSSVKKAFSGIFGNKNEVINAGVVVGKVIGTAFRLILAPISLVAKAVGWLIGGFKQIGTAFMSGVSPVFVVLDLVKGAFDGVKNVAIGVLNFVVGGFKAGFDSLKSVFFGFREVVGAVFKGIGYVLKASLEAPLKVVNWIFNKVKFLFNLLKNNPISKIFGFGKAVIGGAVSKTKEFFTSVFKFKEKQTVKESSVKSVKEIVREKAEKEKVLSGVVKADKLIDKLVININAPTKEAVKELQSQTGSIREQIVEVVKEIFAENERKMRLSYGR